MIEMPRLRLLLALHERGTLHAAADVLHISTSAASQQLAALTREVGTSLTEPDGRKLRFTDAGQVLAKHAYEVVAQLERAQGDIQAAANGQLGQITVGAFPSGITSLLIPALQAVHSQRPRLRVDLREVEIPTCLEQLSTGELDVVVAVESSDAPSAEDPRFVRIPLGTDDFDLAVPAGHRFKHAMATSLSLCADQDWVSSTEGDACDQLLHSTCLAAGFRPKIRHRASDWLAILALVEAGLGLSLVPRSARLPIPERVTVVRTTETISRHLYAAVRCGSTARPSIAAYLSALKDIAAHA